jgi:hypothetical protein
VQLTPSSKITDSTASAVGSIVITTSAFCTAARAEAATVAPASPSGPAAAADRSHTRVLKPAATRLRVIADPMIPAPITATVERRRFVSVISPPPRWTPHDPRRSRSARPVASMPATIGVSG